MAQSLAFLSAFLIVGYGLGIFYNSLSTIDPRPLLTITLLHLSLGLVALSVSHSVRRLVDPRKLTLGASLPALILTFATLALAMSSRLLSGKALPFPSFGWEDYLIVLAIPVGEEILYRGLLQDFIKRWCPHLGWTLYGSALIFALAHTHPTWDPLVIPAPPVGVFLLGGLCAYLRHRTGALWAPIALHISANLTVYLFQWLDPRWLDWLGMLYLSKA
jgi:membrane protease YdiL (CAAX protease family)